MEKEISPELRQAQAAAFAAENPQDDVRTSPRLAELALGDDVGFSPEQTEAIQRFVRSKGPEYAPIDRREELLREYEGFAPIIDPMLAGLDQIDAEKWRKHPNYLDEGYRCAVFKIEKDGQEYAVRVPWPVGTPDKEQKFEGIDKEYLQAGIRTRGVPGFEQFVAASFARDVTVSALVPGSNLEDIAPRDLANVTTEQIENFVETIAYAYIAGLKMDRRLANFMYDPQAGFTLIDLQVRQREKNQPESKHDMRNEEEIMASMISEGATMLGGVGNRLIFMPPQTKREYKTRMGLIEAGISMLEMYRDICGERFPSEVFEVAIRSINAHLISTKQEGERWLPLKDKL